MVRGQKVLGTLRSQSGLLRPFWPLRLRRPGLVAHGYSARLTDPFKTALMSARSRTA